MTKICLIDGSGYIFRAFYALPNMTAPNGTPINAVYGVVTMFMRLLNKIDCDYVAVVFDAKRENFRNQIYKEYKANRTEIPELLIPQFDVVHQAVEALNLPWIAMEGYEADDLIATYADMAAKKGWQVVVVSGDKDLMQLISENVEFYDGMKDKFFTTADVIEKFGVTPDKVVDVQALMGDKVDNIPGVPGIGPKTAGELIREFGSLQALLNSAEKIPQARRRELIMQNKDAALISLKLATLNKNSPVTMDLEEFKMRAPDTKTILAFADKYGFKSIHPKLEQWAKERGEKIGIDTPVSPKKSVQKNYIRLENKSILNNCLTEINAAHQLTFKVWQKEGKAVSISLSATENNVYFLSLEQEKPLDLFTVSNAVGLPKSDIIKFLTGVFNNADILKISAQIKEQWHLLEAYLQADLSLFPYHDISLMSYVLDSSEHGHSLSELAEVCLGENIEPEEKQNTDDFNAKDNFYAYKAADFILPIYNILKKRIFTEHHTYVYETIERRLIEILQKMEKRGIKVDTDYLKRLDLELSNDLQKIETQVYALAGEEFNIASPKQIGQILFEKMGLKGKHNSSGSYNTSAEVLEKLAEENELAAKILEWRGFAKLKSTYTTSLLELKDKNDVVHTTFAQTVVNTGRLASSNPNLQNIPNHSDVGRKIRACFVARKGYKIIDADYSQMELRLLAEVADVKALKEAFEKGVDIHTSTAAKVFGLPYESVDKEHRSRAKAINFGIVYGISQYGLAKQIGVSNLEAKQYIDSYFAIMPEIKDYMEKTKNFAHQNGYVETPFGRKCSIFGINSDNKAIAAMAERAAINAPIQGGAADFAMQRVDYALRQSGYNARILLQVHDELVVEASENQAEAVAELVRQTMENIPELKIKMPVDANISNNWADAH